MQTKGLDFKIPFWHIKYSGLWIPFMQIKYLNWRLVIQRYIIFLLVFLQQKPLFKVSKNCQSKFSNFVQTFAACEILKTFAILISSRGDRTEEKVFELKIKGKRRESCLLCCTFHIKYLACFFCIKSPWRSNLCMDFLSKWSTLSVLMLLAIFAYIKVTDSELNLNSI